MKQGLSGSAVNELDVSDFIEAQRQTAIVLLAKLKEKPCDKLYRCDSFTIKSVGFDEFMIRRKKIKVTFKRNE